MLVKNNTRSEQARIEGRITDKETRDGLKIAQIEINSQRIKADTNGRFRVNVSPGTYIVSGLCYPYHRVTTKRFKIKPGTSVTLNFELVIDKTPLE